MLLPPNVDCFLLQEEAAEDNSSKAEASNRWQRQSYFNQQVRPTDADVDADDATAAANAEEEDECVVSKWSTAGPNLQNHGSIVSGGRSSAFCPTFRKER